MENKGMRILQWTILLLVLCNIGLIVTIWFRPHPGSPPHGGSTRDYVIDKLKFSPDQVQKYDVLVKAHQQSMRKLRHDADEYRSQLFAGLKTANSSSADSFSRLVGATQQQIEKATFDHFAQVRTLCTDTQKQEFDNIIADVLKRMGGHHGPPPGDGPPHGPGDGPPPGDDGPPPGDDGPPPPPGGPQNP